MLHEVCLLLCYLFLTGLVRYISTEYVPFCIPRRFFYVEAQKTNLTTYSRSSSAVPIPSYTKSLKVVSTLIGGENERHPTLLLLCLVAPCGQTYLLGYKFITPHKEANPLCSRSQLPSGAKLFSAARGDDALPPDFICMAKMPSVPPFDGTEEVVAYCPATARGRAKNTWCTPMQSGLCIWSLYL